MIGVTGATGQLGGLVAHGLAAAGVHQRLLVRSPGRAPDLPGATVVRCDFADPPVARAALEGITTLLMVSASETPDRLAQHRAFVDAARDAGVAHVVYTSFFGASPTATFTLARDHAATEDHLRRSGMDWTFLRNNFYLDFLAHLPGEDGVVRGPAGDGRVAAAARADAAACARAVLTFPEPHADRTYSLTGPESLTFTDVAQVLSDVTGRTVTYHDETVEEAYESRRRWEAPDWQYDAWVSTYTAIAAGELDGVTDDVRRLTGRAPTSLRELLARSG